jgi:hypothetical protein
VRSKRPFLSGLLTAVAVGAAACGGGDGRDRADTIRWPRMDPQDKHFPDVVAGRLDPIGGNRFDVVVSLSSPYDSRFRFANGWRLLSSAGDFIGERRFYRHHALQQPWTTRLRSVRIPRGVREVVLEGRDVQYGWGGGALFLRVPGRPHA